MFCLYTHLFFDIYLTWPESGQNTRGATNETNRKKTEKEKKAKRKLVANKNEAKHFTNKEKEEEMKMNNSNKTTILTTTILSATITTTIKNMAKRKEKLGSNDMKIVKVHRLKQSTK